MPKSDDRAYDYVIAINGLLDKYNSPYVARVVNGTVLITTITTKLEDSKCIARVKYDATSLESFYYGSLVGVIVNADYAISQVRYMR